jgi:hypothetical protein
MTMLADDRAGRLRRSFFGRRVADRHAAWVALVAYAALAVVLFWGGWRAPLTRNVGAGGDMPIFGWSLRWAPWAVAHGHNPLFTKYLGYPAGSNLMWNTSVFLPSLLVAPVTLLSTPVLAYNVLATLGVVLPAWALFGALRLATRHPLAAWLGGLAWGFGPWIIAQTRGDHLHLSLGSLALPLLAFAAHDAFIVQRRRPRVVGLVTGAGAAAWLLVGEEALAIAAVTIGVATLALALVSHGWWHHGGRARARHGAAVLGWALVAFVPLAAFPLGMQFLGPQRVHGTIFPNDRYDADLPASVLPTGHVLVDLGQGTTLRFHTGEGGYLGIPLIALAGVVTVRQRRRPAVRAAALSAAALWVLSLGSHLHVVGHATRIPLPWDALRHVPLLTNLLPVRLTMGVAAILATLLAVGADDLLSTRAGPLAPGHDRRVVLATGLLGALALVAMVPQVPFRSTLLPVPAYFTSNDVSRIPAGSLVLVAPVARPERPWVQLWQADAGMQFRMEGGYLLVPDAHGHASFSSPLSPAATTVTAIELGGTPPFSDASVASDLRAHHVSTVVVGPMAHRDQVVALFERVLDAQPAQTGGVSVWYGVPALLSRVPIAPR